MKRLVSLTAAVMAIAMMFTLAACGGGDDKEPAPETETQTETQTEAVDLAALSKQIIADCGITDYVEIAAENLGDIYGVNTADVKSAAGFTASSGAAFPQEVVMIEAASEDAAAAMGDTLNNHLTAIADQAASYDPDSLALAESCKIVTKGAYVGMFFSEHYDAMVSAFQGMVG